MKKNNFDWEDKAAQEDSLYRRGKAIAQQLIDFGISESDEFEFRAFIDDLSEADMQAYAYYDEKRSTQSTLEPIRPADSAKPAAPQQDSTPSYEKLELAFRGVSAPGKLLSEALTLYLKKQATSVVAGTLRDIETDVNRLLMFVGDIPTDQLTKSVLTERYIDRRRQLPNGVHQKKEYSNGKIHKIDRITGKPQYRGNGKPVMTPNYKPIDEILAIAASNPDTKYNTERTIYNEFEQIKAFLRWCHTRGYVESGLDTLLAEASERPDESTTTNFTDEDLKLIFESDSYREGRLLKSPHFHWLPLISLYHGNRIGEITMLYIDNVFQVEVPDGKGVKKIWVFDIENNSERKQRVKNKRSMRVIPIHQTLIDLGLITYRDQLAAQGEERLFPEEAPNGKGNWGGKTSIWFNNSHDNNKNGIGFAEFCGVQKHVRIRDVVKKKVFHSLRGNWITRANRLGLNQDMCRELTGHSLGMQLDIHTLSYDEGSELHTRHAEINKLHYDIDTDCIARWK